MTRAARFSQAGLCVRKARIEPNGAIELVAGGTRAVDVKTKGGSIG